MEAVQNVEVEEPSRVASILRGAGAGAILLSAVVYMLQGIDYIGIELRQWVYIALVGGLAGAGVMVRRWFDDAKSARLCFALAGGALVVQVSQIAGMLHELLNGGGTGFWIDFSHVTAGSTLVTGLVTAVLFVPVAFTAFSVLQRSVARNLTWAYGLAAALLLLPMRSGISAILVLVALASIWFCMERYQFRLLPTANTLEGYGARALLALPLSIALVRHGFHVDDVAGAALLVLFVSGAGLGLALVWMHRGLMRDVVAVSAALIGSLAWLVLAGELWSVESLSGQYAVAVPVVMLALTLARCTCKLTQPLRVFAVVIAAGPVVSQLADNTTFTGALVLTAVGGVLAAWGFVYRERETFVPGAMLAVGGVGIAVVEALTHIEVNSWLSLAAGGVLLVVLASVLERYGAAMLGRMRGGLKEVSAWR